MRNVYGWSVVALVGLIGTAIAQNEAQPLQPGVGQTPRGTAGAQATQPGRLGQPAFGQEQSSQEGTSDQQIAALLLACCRNEVEIAKFAQDRLQSPQAKAFAEKMVEEHSQGCEKLAQLAGPLAEGLHASGDDPSGALRPGALRPGATRPGRPGADRPGADRPGADRPGADRPGADRPGADRPGADRPDQLRVVRDDVTFVALQQETREVPQAGAAAAQRGDDPPAAGQRRAAPSGQAGRTPFGQAGRAGQAGELDWTAIHREIAEKALQGTKEELERHQGHEFDRAFLGQQLLAHGMAINEMEVLKNHASPQLQQVIDSEIQMAKRHQEEARRLMDQLASDPSAVRTARQPGETRRPGQVERPEQGERPERSPQPENPPRRPQP